MKTILLIIIFFCSTQILAGTVTKTLRWSGGLCSICNTTFACSNDAENWHNGINSFFDPIPNGNYVSDIKVILEGNLVCNLDHSYVGITLNGIPIQNKILQGHCSCDSCDQMSIFEWKDFNSSCFPGYNYNKYNILKINLLDDMSLICISKATIELTYLEGKTNCLDIPFECEFGCGNGECKIDQNTFVPKCECPYENFGPNCQCIATNQSTNQSNNDPIVSLNIGESGFKTRDEFYIALNYSTEYFETKIEFKNELGLDCDFLNPSSSARWQTEFNEIRCQNNLIGIISWSSSWPACIFNKNDSDTNWLYFNTQMNIENKKRSKEYIRTFSNIISFQIKYPKLVSIFTEDKNIYSDVNITASIISQSFESSVPILPGSSHIRLYTVISHPFIIISPFDMNGDTSRFSMTVIENLFLKNCANDGNICEQYWDIEITPSQNDCKFEDVFSFNFAIDCNLSNQLNCELEPDTFGKIEFTLMSEDFCSIINEQDNAHGFIECYHNLDLVPSNDFSNGQIIYCKSFIQSISEKIKVMDFSLISNNGKQFDLYQNGEKTNIGKKMAISISSDNFDKQINDIIFIADIHTLQIEPNNIMTFDLKINNKIIYPHNEIFLTSKTMLTIKNNISDVPISSSNIISYLILMDIIIVLSLISNFLF